ncbi:MAG: cation transporter [Chloroflexi bacterium]|nr:cation transporter [Chloroflexota bacterium]
MTADPAFNANAEGIRTVWRALAVLGAATVVQVVIVAASGSVALLADTAHNIGDTLNSIPLLAAFYLARRAATRRFTYGYGRAEDVAGILIVLSIGISAAIVLWESLQKLLNPQPMTNLGWVALAAVVGFIGNEAVALLQIRTGRKIGSAAMIADGLHARTDGLTSLAVLGAVGGTLIGLPILDPLIGLLIGVTIVFITRNAVLQVGARLMDAIDPALLHRMEHAIEDVAGVGRIVSLRARWVGHQIFAEMTITVDAARGIGESHAIAEAVRAAMAKAVRHLGEVTIQIDPG